MTSPGYTLKELCQHLDAELVGDADMLITGLSTLQSAQAGDLAFYVNKRYRKQLETTQASVVLLSADNADLFFGNKLIAVDPYLAFAELTGLFVQASPIAGIDDRAVISGSAVIADSSTVDACAVIAAGVRVGENVRIGAGSYIGENAVIGDNTIVYPNVSILSNVAIGSECVLHSGCVIGADGFGFAPSKTGWRKIHQLGSVVIGSGVEIGANTTIDRGALDDTIIGDGVKIDNQVQIAHNVQIGDHSAIAGAAAIAGSTIIGKRCTIAGAVGIIGHLNIVDDVHITAMTLVTKSITQSGSYSSGVPLNETRQWRKNAARFNQLDSLFRQQKARE